MTTNPTAAPTPSSPHEVGATPHGRRAVVGDVALALFVLVTAATAIYADLEPDARDPGAMAYVLAAAVAAPMLWRRRWPVVTLLATVAALLAYYALGYPAIGLAVPVAAALYSAAERGRTWWAATVATGLLASTTTLRLAQGQDPGFLYGYELSVSATLMAAVISLGVAVRSRRRVETESRLRLEREAERRVADERLRIARDVHDVVGHTVSVISVQADVALESLDDGDVTAARRAVAVIRASSREAMAELRATLGSLREDAPLAPTPGLQDVARLVQQARASGLDVTLAVHGDVGGVPRAVGAAAHRIVQESLTNALRHASARSARVELARRDTDLLVRVTDDGRGGPPGDGPGAGHGIAGMRERAVLLGGALEAGPADGRGFRVLARLPLDRSGVPS